MKLSLNDDNEIDDPALSLINLVDVFLVIIAALIITIANNPLNTLGQDKVTVIRNAGQPNMEIVIKDGKKLEQFSAEGATGAGRGVKVGTAYRMRDGSLVYVPNQ